MDATPVSSDAFQQQKGPAEKPDRGSAWSSDRPLLPIRVSPAVAEEAEEAGKVTGRVSNRRGLFRFSRIFSSGRLLPSSSASSSRSRICVCRKGSRKKQKKRRI